MLGVFFAYGPAFKSGYRKTPIRLIDVYLLICHILSLENCPGDDGDFTKIRDVLQNSGISATAGKVPIFEIFTSIFAVLLSR